MSPELNEAPDGSTSLVCTLRRPCVIIKIKEGRRGGGEGGREGRREGGGREGSKGGRENGEKEGGGKERRREEGEKFLFM